MARGYLIFLALSVTNLMVGCFCNEPEANAKPSSDSRDFEIKKPLEFDANGYVLFCMCMGRFGNQIDHFLGGMAFAKAVNRTLLLPPFMTYKSQPFDEWFQLDVLKQYHRIEPAERFMAELAPRYWPPEERVGFCWLPPNHGRESCKMKEGNPFGPFWNGLNVDFARDEIYHISYAKPSLWSRDYPPEKYPVLAFRGAPAGFPVLPANRHLQKYLEFTPLITDEGDEYIKKTFGDEKFIGIHLRNGIDWERACEHSEGVRSYMASPQCLNGVNKLVTHEICMPSKETVLDLTKKIVKMTNAKFIYVATDKNPMIKDLEEHLSKQNVKVFHMDPHLPWVDLYVLSQSHHFIGNCVSSFTSFAKRARDVTGKPSSFWGVN